MPISSTQRKVGPTPGNGTSRDFPFTFKVFAASDIDVIRTSANGGDISLTQPSDYVVTLNPDQNVAPGGNVRLSEALPIGLSLTILSAVPITQLSNWQSQGGFNPDDLDDDLDRQTAVSQQLAEQLGRTLVVPATASDEPIQMAKPEGDAILAWSADGTRIINLDPSALASHAAYSSSELDVFTGNGVETVFNLSLDGGSLANLRVAIAGVAQTPGEDFQWNGGTEVQFAEAPGAGLKIVIQYFAVMTPVEGKANTDLGNSAIAVRPNAATEPASSLIRRKFRNYFDPTDPQFGATVGGVTGNATADLAKAQANRIAFQACANAFKAAVIAGERNSVFYIPPKDFLICSAPFAGLAPPSLGVSAVGGGHWRGAGNLPLSAGWSCHALVFDGLTGGRLHSEGGRLIRVENDPYNTGTAADDTNSTVLIARSTGYSVTGRWEAEGFQEGVVHSTTSGNFLDISYGCRDFSISADLWSWKGTNALAIGNNRASGYSAAAGGVTQTGIDISQPCLDWEVSGVIEAYDGEHAVFVAVSDRGRIGRIQHRHKDYTYGGVPQGDYVQRTLYLQGCGQIEVDSVDSTVANKVGILLSAYPTTRTYKDLDAVIHSVNLNAPLAQDSDFYTGVELNEQNRSLDTLRRIKAKIGTLTSRGHKVGIGYRDLGDALSISGASVVSRFEVGKIDIEATVSGIAITPYGQASNIKLGSGSVDVRARPEYSASSVPSSGVTLTSRKGVAAGAAAADFIQNVTIGQLDVVSGNRTAAIQTVDGLQITGATFRYEAQGVSGAQTYDIRVDYSKNYGPISFRTGAGNVNQTTPLETMPLPFKGYFSRVTAYDPSTIAAGSSTNASRAVAGARVGMSARATIASPPSGLTADAVVSADDNVIVYTRNVGSAAYAGGSLTYYIEVTAK